MMECVAPYSLWHLPHLRPFRTSECVSSPLDIACNPRCALWAANALQEAGPAPLESPRLPIYRLEQRGLLATEWGESESGRRTKVYSLTADGRKQLEEQRVSWERFTGALGAILGVGGSLSEEAP